MQSQPIPSREKLGFQTDWNNYMEYRPAYPPNFFNRLYDEHAKHLGSFGTVNDVGAGAGIASEILAKKFKRVVVSEPNTEYLKVAEKRLNNMEKFPKDKFSFLPEGGEKSSLPDATLDCLTICEALHWSHVETSINEFARVLKPGGTLGIFHYSPAKLEDPALNELWDELYGNATDRITTDEVFARAYHNLSNAYQNIYFDPKIWKGVRRVYTNTEGRLDRLRPAAANVLAKGGDNIPDFVKRWAVPPQNNVGQDDVMEWIEGDEDWVFERDANWFENSLGLGKGNKALVKKEEYDEWMKLRRAIGDKKVKIHYLMLQVIATKR